MHYGTFWVFWAIVLIIIYLTNKNPDSSSCDFENVSVGGIIVTCQNQQCSFTGNNPQWPLIVKYAIVGEVASLYADGADFWGVIYNCNAFTIIAEDDLDTLTIAPNSAGYAAAGNFQRDYVITRE